MSEDLNIANSTEVVEECVQKVQSARDKFIMLKLYENACEGIAADIRCLDTYNRGVKVASNYKAIIDEMIVNMNQISKVLEDADKIVANENKNYSG